VRALILGIGGQDGSYLADILLAKGYEVHGLYRRSSVNNLQRIEHCLGSVHPHQGDLTEPNSLLRIIDDVQPSLIFNEADQDDIRWSYTLPSYAFDVTTKGVINLLEAVRHVDDRIKVFQPCSSSMYENSSYAIAPKSPYAIAKYAAYLICTHYRAVHGLRITCGIMFNHDSPRRSSGYLLQEVCEQALAVASGKQQHISLRYPGAFLDLGYAYDYMVDAVNLLEEAPPCDVQVCTGKPMTPRKLVQMAADILKTDLPINTTGVGAQPAPLVGDIGQLTDTLRKVSRIDTALLVELVINKHRGL
jgi:GDPmannose 4,6-dehydratase